MFLISINVGGITSTKDLHKLLKKELNFPDFYGMNWDAFWDSITGLVEMPEQLEIKGWENLRKVLNYDAEMLLKCLNEYNEQPDLKKIEILIT